MVDNELDSGERKALKLELQVTKELGEIKGTLLSLPKDFKLTVIEAMREHESGCAARKVKPLSPKVLVSLIGVITALIGIIGTLLAT